MIDVLSKKLIVPKGVRYISKWNEYSLKYFQFPHILDKQIPGCGYTEYCLWCDLPIILASPRKILLENKEMQHKGDVFYFKNELDKDLGMDKDVSKLPKHDTTMTSVATVYTDEEITDILNKLYERLDLYLSKCSSSGLTPKILVTYDSYRLVKEFLLQKNFFQYFYTVVDEFQSIFTDSRFKSTTEMEFVYQLQGVQRVCYVSATPMINEYLQKIDEFKDLPYFEIDWKTEDPDRVVVPDLKVRVCSSVNAAAKTIIEDYKNEKFESAYITDELGQLVEIKSTEAVIYVNSVNNILGIIKGNGLEPEECNILCAKTPENIKRIKNRLGHKWEIGSVPLLGEPHKMFTFCTRTVYLGADFYSNVARSFILSDANIESLAVDITLDLPQILGRQRLTSNPWKNRAELYYKTLKSNGKISKEEFDDIIKNKIQKTQDLLYSYSATDKSSAKHTLAVEYQYLAKSKNYRDHYVAVNTHGGKDLVPCLNNLVLIAEQRAYDIQQKDYKDRFTVFSTIVDNNLINLDITNNINLFLETFNGFNNFYDKMKYLCEAELSDNEKLIVLDQIPLTYKNYYLIFGPEGCKAKGYNQTYLSRALSDLKFNKEDLKAEIYNIFQIGTRYKKADIKFILADLYDKLSYNKTAKANDLEEYFEIKRCMIGPDNGFEILSKK